MLTAEGREIARRHFLAQDERPDAVGEVEVGAVEPFLRNLLFTDGTITRALAVQTLDPVVVTRVDQTEVPTPAATAEQLEIEPGEESVRRRVGIGVGAEAPVIWAESHLVPSRLPSGFLGRLDEAPQGIGQSLQRHALESYRELLWFGLTTPPPWAASAWSDGRSIERLYRIVSERRAAILISESFAVEERGGAFHLAGLRDGLRRRGGDG